MISERPVIVCPHCKRQIPLDEALSHQVREKLEAEIREELKEKEEEIAAVKSRLAASGEEMERLKEEGARRLDEYKRQAAGELTAKIDEMTRKVRDEAERKAAEKVLTEMTDLKGQIEEKARQVDEFRTQELELRKEKRRIEEEKKNLAIEVERKIDEERQKIKADAERTVLDQLRLKEKEKDKVIDDLRRQIEDLKQRAEQSSQQLKGEVLELELEEILRTGFPEDLIEPVPKGIRGADVIQKVCYRGNVCGSIMWESKRTRAWSDGWIDKLKEDQRQAKADLAVIVSVTLPKGMTGIIQMNGVWVTDFTLIHGLALALRAGLVDLAAVRQSAVGKGAKMEMLYEYLAGSEFRQHIEGIVEAFSTMRSDLDAEKRAMEKLWAKREKQIEKVVRNTGRMYGSLQGIIGSTLPELDSLGLAALGTSAGE